VGHSVQHASPDVTISTIVLFLVLCSDWWIQRASKSRCIVIVSWCWGRCRWSTCQEVKDLTITSSFGISAQCPFGSNFHCRASVSTTTTTCSYDYVSVSTKWI